MYLIGVSECNRIYKYFRDCFDDDHIRIKQTAEYRRGLERVYDFRPTAAVMPGRSSSSSWSSSLED